MREGRAKESLRLGRLPFSEAPKGRAAPVRELKPAQCFVARLLREAETRPLWFSYGHASGFRAGPLLQLSRYRSHFPGLSRRPGDYAAASGPYRCDVAESSRQPVAAID